MSLDQNGILIIINIIAALLAPLITSFSWTLKHISESSCCGATSIKIREDSEIQLKKLSVEEEKLKKQLDV